MGKTSRCREDGRHEGTGKLTVGNGEGVHEPDWGDWLGYDMGWTVRYCRVKWCEEEEARAPGEVTA